MDRQFIIMMQYSTVILLPSYTLLNNSLQLITDTISRSSYLHFRTQSASHSALHAVKSFSSVPEKKTILQIGVLKPSISEV